MVGVSRVCERRRRLRRPTTCSPSLAHSLPSRLQVRLRLQHICNCLSPGVAQPLSPPEGAHTPPDQDDHHQYTTLIYISPPGQVCTFNLALSPGP